MKILKCGGKKECRKLAFWEECHLPMSKGFEMNKGAINCLKKQQSYGKEQSLQISALGGYSHSLLCE